MRTAITSNATLREHLNQTRLDFAWPLRDRFGGCMQLASAGPRALQYRRKQNVFEIWVRKLKERKRPFGNWAQISGRRSWSHDDILYLHVRCLHCTLQLDVSGWVTPQRQQLCLASTQRAPSYGWLYLAEAPPHGPHLHLVCRLRMRTISNTLYLCRSPGLTPTKLRNLCSHCSSFITSHPDIGSPVHRRV